MHFIQAGPPSIYHHTHRGHISLVASSVVSSKSPSVLKELHYATPKTA